MRRIIVAVFTASILILVGSAVQASSTQSDLPLIGDVVPCTAEPHLCLIGDNASGLYVTLIDSAGKRCSARTGNQAEADTGGGWSNGTQIVNMECTDAGDFKIAVLSSRKGFVTDFEWLVAEKITDKKQIHQFAKMLMDAERFSLDQAEIIFGEGPPIKVLRHPHPTSEFYSVKFNSCPGPLFFIQGNKIAGEVDQSGSEHEWSYFRLNNRYYIGICSGGCETECGSGFIDVFSLFKK